jgi:hypothetical protein
LCGEEGVEGVREFDLKRIHTMHKHARQIKETKMVKQIVFGREIIILFET